MNLINRKYHLKKKILNDNDIHRLVELFIVLAIFDFYFNVKKKQRNDDRYYNE
jgi:hypothetical protein